MDDTTAQITLRVQSTQTSAPCPLCATPRGASIVTMGAPGGPALGTVSGVPPAARAQVVLPQSRLSASYLHRTAAHRGRPLGAPHPTAYPAPGRPGYGAGGKAGMRLGQQWDLAVSRNTLLRGLHRQQAPSFPTPRVLGVDDFAPQTAHLRHDPGGSRVWQPVALLPERTAEPVAQWLREHPGVEVIARDRSSAYGDGARHGAPAATQVADRFHLLQNLREALDQVFSTHSQALDAVNVLVHQQPVPLPRWGDGRACATPGPLAPCAAARRAAPGPPAGAPYASLGLAPPGVDGPAIAQHVGMSLRSPARPPERHLCGAQTSQRPRGQCAHPYKPYLLERWNAGCYTAMRLFRDLRQRGYAGGYGVVAAYVRRLRQAQGLPPGHRCPRQALPPVAEPPCQPLTPRRATWLVLRREAKRTEAEAQQLAQLRAQQAEVTEAIDLAQDFATLVRQRQPEALDPGCARDGQYAGGLATLCERTV